MVSWMMLAGPTIQLRVPTPRQRCVAEAAQRPAAGPLKGAADRVDRASRLSSRTSGGRPEKTRRRRFHRRSPASGGADAVPVPGPEWRTFPRLERDTPGDRVLRSRS